MVMSCVKALHVAEVAAIARSPRAAYDRDWGLNTALSAVNARICRLRSPAPSARGLDKHLEVRWLNPP
jgi:hypothetical protein